MSHDQIEVRGHSRFVRRASMLLRFFAGTTDFFIGALLLELTYVALRMDPLLDWKAAPLFAAAILIPWWIARAVMGASIGERIWKTRAGKTGFRELHDNLIAIFLTIGISGAFLWVFSSRIAAHPYWSSSKPLVLQPAVPPDDWRVLPFYYTLAPWPVSIAGRPVFYSVPYEQGPPMRFVGHVEAEWIRGSVRVIFEGPKTPVEFQSRVRNRKSVRDCFASLPLFSPGCLEVRKTTLARPLQELRDSGYAKFEVSWFSAENPVIPAEQRAQGVRLRASAESKIQDRYILITPQGLHQSIAISYLDSSEGHEAERQFEIALGALRISEDLNQGRAWADHLLETIRLDQLPPITGENYLAALSQIQSILVSKLTVDPGTFDPYYHLAGSHLLLLKYCLKHDDPELKSLALAMLERMTHFAHDVSPKNPRIPDLDRLAHEAKQF